MAQSAVGIVLKDFLGARTKAKIALKGERGAVDVLATQAGMARSAATAWVHINTVSDLDAVYAGTYFSNNTRGIKTINCRQFWKRKVGEPGGIALDDIAKVRY
ncbi:hypothetical protein D3C76_1061920 [compost metagenome]